MSPNIQENVSLKDLTTMHVGGPARFFIEAKNIEDLRSAIDWAKEKNLSVFILGGGSNLVISDAGFPGLVIQVKIKYWEVLHEDDDKVFLKIGAGENWDEVVARAVRHGWWGLENLSLIYGTLGGIIVQNAGAYGAEISSVVNRVEIYDREISEVKEFFKDDCHFGYRSSLFQKTERYLILSAVLELKKTGMPNINYPDVAKYFVEKNIIEPNLSDIRQAIATIRQYKLPDPEVLGSAGSFFKNLLLTTEEYQKLKEKISANFNSDTVTNLEEIKNKFPMAEAIKIPTAWILDICGLKGESAGQAFIYEKQPLIIINKNNSATADDIMNLVKKVRQTVFAKTGIELELEPELVGFSQEELLGYLKIKN